MGLISLSTPMGAEQYASVDWVKTKATYVRDWSVEHAQIAYSKAQAAYAVLAKKTQQAYQFASENKKLVGGAVAATVYALYDIYAYNQGWKFSMLNTLFGVDVSADNPVPHPTAPVVPVPVPGNNVASQPVRHQVPNVPVNSPVSPVISPVPSQPIAPVIPAQMPQLHAVATSSPSMLAEPLTQELAAAQVAISTAPQALEASQAPVSPQNMQKHYEVLGLAHGASNSEIDAAFKRLVRTYHPDKTGAYTDHAQAIIEARNALKNNNKDQVTGQGSALSCQADVLLLTNGNGNTDNLENSWQIVPNRLEDSWVDLSTSSIVPIPVPINERGIYCITDQIRGELFKRSDKDKLQYLDINNNVHQVLRVGNVAVEPTKILFVIHGTWSKNSPSFYAQTDTELNADMEGFLDFANYLRDADQSIDVISFKWSGINSIPERQKAARELAELTDLYASKVMYAVSHSHGGNVINAASHMMQHASIDGVFSIFTPIREGKDKEFIPNHKTINALYHFYSTQDVIQYFGEYENWNTLAPFKGGRKQLGNGMNVRVQYDADFGPAHTNKAPLARNLATIIECLKSYEYVRDLDLNIDTKTNDVQVAMRQGSNTVKMLATIEETIDASNTPRILLQQFEKECNQLQEGANKFKEKHGRDIGDKGWYLGAWQQVTDFICSKFKKLQEHVTNKEHTILKNSQRVPFDTSLAQFILSRTESQEPTSHKADE